MNAPDGEIGVNIETGNLNVAQDGATIGGGLTVYDSLTVQTGYDDDHRGRRTDRGRSHREQGAWDGMQLPLR